MSKEVDAYFAQAQPFTRPILKKLRSLVHKGCPSAVETMKWRVPFYMYNDRALCATAGFKKHCVLMFWKGSLIGKDSATAKAELKQLRKIKSLDDLPSDKVILAYIKRAMHFNESTTKLPPRSVRSEATMPKMPREFELSLKANAKAKKHFAGFSPSKKKDYIFWIASAKTDETRDRRIEQSVDWISEGKSRNWKYEESNKKRAPKKQR